MKNTMINTTIFLAVIGAMFAIQVTNDHTYADDVAREEFEKHKQELKLIEATSKLCGNGVESFNKDGSVTCKVRKALKAGSVKL